MHLLAVQILLVVSHISSFIIHSDEENKGPNEGFFQKPEKYRFLQVLNHFDVTDKRTFYQHYFLNDKYIKLDSPKAVILFIGGEYTLTADKIFSGFITKIASEFEALIVGLEHRHYGDSKLDGNYTRKDLGTLTSQQALADLVFFWWHINEKYNLDDRVKWITMGGSYAGMLASWARIKFPHLFHAAYASSAPVEATVRFDQYLRKVGYAYGNPDFNGSDKCQDRISNTFAEIDKVYYNSTVENFGSYDRYLKSCEPTVTDEDRRLLVSEVVDVFSGVVQYNNKKNKLNIEVTCEIFMKDDDPWERVKTFLELYLSAVGSSCLRIDWYKGLIGEKNFEINDDIAWFYQTCREFGYFLHCNRDIECIFSDLVKGSPEIVMCSKLFGINDHMTSGYVDFTNAYYGSSSPGGSRILYVNGLVDPWTLLATRDENKEREQIVYEIVSGSHHQEFDEPDLDDPIELTDARKFVMQNLKKWLE